MVNTNEHNDLFAEVRFRRTYFPLRRPRRPGPFQPFPSLKRPLRLAECFSLISRVTWTPQGSPPSSPGQRGPRSPLPSSPMKTTYQKHQKSDKKHPPPTKEQSFTCTSARLALSGTTPRSSGPHIRSYSAPTECFSTSSST
jgi:hypothetical protein